MRYAAILLAGIFIISGCTAAHRQAASPGERPPIKISQTGTVSIKSQPVQGVPDLIRPESDQQIAIEAELRLAVASPDSVFNRLADITQECHGNIMTFATQRAEIKIPSVSFKEIMTRIEQLGRLADRKITARDMTILYRDFQLRLETAMKTRDRYLELLTKATTVDEVIKVEKELERITGTIEDIKRNLQTMDNQMQYARIVVTLYTPVEYKPGPLGFVFYQLYKGAAWLLVHK